MGVVEGDFCPEGGGVIHVVDVGEFVEDDVVAEGFGEVHDTDVERDGAGAGAAAPAGVGVGEAQAGVGVAVFLGPEVEAVGEVGFGFFGEEFFLGIAGALGLWVFEGELLSNLFPAGV